MLLEVKNCIKRDSKNKLWSKIEKNNRTKTIRQLMLVSYEICQIHSLDCTSDLGQEKFFCSFITCGWDRSTGDIFHNFKILGLHLDQRLFIDYS